MEIKLDVQYSFTYGAARIPDPLGDIVEVYFAINGNTAQIVYPQHNIAVATITVLPVDPEAGHDSTAMEVDGEWVHLADSDYAPYREMLAVMTTHLVTGKKALDEAMAELQP